MDASPIAQRKSRYQIFTAKIRILNLHTNVQSEGIVTELSESGCFVLTKKPLAAQTRVWVKLKSKNVEFDCAAMVLESSKSAGMHLGFIRPAPEQQEILKEWMQASAATRLPAG